MKEQRQKEYHERLKEKDNEKYLKDAREKQKRIYISVKNMGGTRERKDVLLLENV